MYMICSLTGRPSHMSKIRSEFDTGQSRLIWFCDIDMLTENWDT